MTEEELTHFEKAGLLAIKDHFNPDGYDVGFYILLQTTRIPDILIMDGAIRQALSKFIPEYWDNLQSTMSLVGADRDSIIQAAMTCSLLKGYELGRKLRQPLTLKPESQSQQASSK